MSLLTSELEMVRAECGYNVLSAGAEPYVSYVAVFDQVVATYLQMGAITSSSTTVVAASPAAQVSLTLLSATGITAGDKLVVDVDSRQETATIQSLTGSVATLLLSKAHSGTYPVTVEGGEAIVRENLRQIANVKMRIGLGVNRAGLKRVDEVEWYQGRKGGSALLDDQLRLLGFWRDQLCACIGVQNLWKLRGSETLSPSLY